MKLLVVSDLHLCDRRNNDLSDEERLEKLGRFIRESGTEAVLNLGDTVSRPPLLIEKFADIEEGFKPYLKWRQTVALPFAECAIARESGFFSKIMGQECDQLFELDPQTSIITLLQLEPYRLSAAQEECVLHALERSHGKTVVAGTHVPFAGSCSRKGDFFLKVSVDLRKKLISFPGRIIWCGGHFHWDQEPPETTGSLTALYPSRFRISGRNDYSYTTLIDTVSGELTVNFHDF